jgi:hypothetical protein
MSKDFVGLSLQRGKGIGQRHKPRLVVGSVTPGLPALVQCACPTVCYLSRLPSWEWLALGIDARPYLLFSSLFKDFSPQLVLFFSEGFKIDSGRTSG